jgi:hypothetical protein
MQSKSVDNHAWQDAGENNGASWYTSQDSNKTDRMQAKAVQSAVHLTHLASHLRFKLPKVGSNLQEDDWTYKNMP